MKINKILKYLVAVFGGLLIIFLSSLFFSSEKVTPTKEMLLKNRIDPITAYLKSGGNIDVCIDPYTKETMLHFAAKNGLDTIIDFLLSSNANIDATNRNQRTALHEAVENGQFAIVKKLLTHRANKNVKDINGNTPLDLAKEWVSLIENDQTPRQVLENYKKTLEILKEYY